MTDQQDIAAVAVGEGDRVAVAYFVTGAVFLVVGGALAALSLMATRFDALFPFGVGRLEPISNLILMVGFGVISLLGGAYYALPRLTGSRLWGADLASLGLAATTLLVIAGAAAVALGFGDGREPLALPWWIDLPMLGALGLPFLIVVNTIMDRTETRSYVTVWFVLGGVTWLPVLYLAHVVGDLPVVSAVAVAYADALLTAGVVTMFLLTVGSGLLYFTVLRDLDVPLASRPLALVGFWSLGIAAGWWGAAQLMFGPGPNWIDGVAAALGLALPIGALVNAANVSLSLEGAWGEVRETPSVSAGLAGLYLGVGVAVLAAIAGFRSVASVVALTPFWEAVEFAFIAGVVPLLAAGTAFSALPRIAGRHIYTTERAQSFVRLTLAGATGVLVTMGGAGVVTGYGWIAGSNSAAFVDAADGWGTAWGGAADALLLLAVGFGVVTLVGHLAYLSVLLGTMTTGRAATQEMLVSVGADHE